MGNIICKKKIENLEKECNRKDKIISEQSHIINLLKNETYGGQCIKDGIIQTGGDNILTDIDNVKKNKDYEYIVFSGGGTKGVSYCGVVDALQELSILFNENNEPKIKGYAGTSAGSIIAAFMAIGTRPDKVKELLKILDIEKIVDDKAGIIRDTINFVDSYGVCEGDYIYNFVGDVVKEQLGDPDYTIEKLYLEHGVKLVIVGVNVNTRQAVYFHPTSINDNYKKIPIRLAVRISMGIPFLFEPIFYDNDYFVDGGIIDNYAIHSFDSDSPDDIKAILNLEKPNPKVLGLKIITDEVEKSYAMTSREDINNLFQFSASHVDIIVAQSQRIDMTPANYKRTIYIMTPDYPLLDFSLTEEQKQTLIKAGYSSTLIYFDSSK